MKRNIPGLKKYCLFLIVLISLLVGTGNSVQGQVTIVSDGLNNSSTLFTLSNGAYYTGNSATTSRPASSPYAIEGTHSRGATNTTATLTATSNINTSDYNNIILSLRVAAFSINATNGMDAADYVRVEISPNGGTNWYNTLEILGNNNAYWAYSTGTGVVSTPYDGNMTTVQFAPSAGGNRTTDGYSTINITNLPATSTLSVRITLACNNNERWVVDDFKITGVTSSPFWYKADGVTPFNGTTWNDETTNNIDAVLSSGTITLATNSVNYNPSLTFTNTDRQMLTSLSAQVKSLIVVTLPTTNTDIAGLIGAGPGSVTDKGIRLSNDPGDGIEDASWRGDNNADDWYSGGGSRVNGNSNTFLHNFKWHIVNQTRGAALISQFYLGGYYAGRSYSGNIAEVMAFAGDVPNQDYVESYLAIKYGITLPGNYYASDGSANWTLVSGYQNDVHGIGRDDTYGLNQLSSKSENPGTDMLIIQSGASFSTPSNAQTGTALTNRQYFITGHNNGITTAFSNLSTGINILGRKWNAQVTNSLPTESFQFNLTGATIPSPYCKIGVLIADDAAFTTNLRFVEGTFSTPTLTVNNVAITNGKYFTVAQLLTPSAGAISGTQTICNGTSPSTITSLTDGTGFGTITYLWESSVDGLTWNPVSGATNSSYSPGTLTQTTQYRRTTIATLGTVSCNSATSAPVTVTVRPVFTSGAILITGETICSGGDPGEIGSSSSASGGDNSITYEWRASGTPIASTNSSTYDPPAGLTATTTYTRWAKDGTCSTTFTQSTGSWVVTVNPLPIVSIASNNSPVCAGENAVFNLTGTSNATVTYKLNSGADKTIVLTAVGTATITVTGATFNQTLTLVSVADANCSQSLSENSTLTVNPLPGTGEIIPD